MKREILEYSFEKEVAHIPSALSMCDYVEELFVKKLVTPEDKIVIGKPFGAQAYYVVWKKMGYIKDFDNLSPVLKMDEIDFVDFSEETMGDSLGIAAGIALTTEKLVWVNLTDATLQMGPTLEAIQFIGQNCLKNVLVTVDYNGTQVTGKTKDIINTDPVIELFRSYNWEVFYDLKNFNISEKPKVFIMKTKKGNGVRTMENDIKKWHYRKIESKEELDFLIEEIEK
jgi:transketolase